MTELCGPRWPGRRRDSGLIATAEQLNARIEDVAELLLGPANGALSTRTQLRFGRQGSLAVELAGVKRGQWYDHENKIGGGALDLVRRQTGLSEREALAWVASRLGIADAPRPRPRRIVTAYDYCDERGTLLFQVVRYAPKTFRQRRPDGSGGWSWRIKGVRQVPYRLPELRAAGNDVPVFVVEGEKDADRLASLGLVATCNAGGANTWPEALTPHFRGRTVFILPDNDGAGRSHAQRVAAALHGVADSVHIVTLPGLPPGGDVSDWLDAGGDAATLLEMCRAAPPWRPGNGAGGRHTHPLLRGSADAGVFRPPCRGSPLLRGVRPLVRVGRRALARGRQATGLHPCAQALPRDIRRDSCRWRGGRGEDRNHRRQRPHGGGGGQPGARRSPSRDGSRGLGRRSMGAEHARRHRRSALGPPVAARPRRRCARRSPRSHPPRPIVRAGGDSWTRSLAAMPSCRGFLARVAGYGLSGSTREHALFFLYGTGANGKGTFLNTLTAILGDYARVAGMETFTESHSDRHPTELAMLRGARIVTAQETEEGRRWAESRIKALTGGDPITARFMRQDFFTYTPQFKLLIAGNHKPGLRNIDEAIRRRFHLLPFTIRIPPECRDAKLFERLKAEWPAILAWAIRGCLAWQADGLRPPAAVIDATAEYFDDEDGFGRWLAECCVRESDGARDDARSLCRVERLGAALRSHHPAASPSSAPP